MPGAATIRSRSNPLLQKVRRVARGREKELLLLEGERLVLEAARSGFELEAILVSEEREALATELEARGLPVRRALASLLEEAGTLKSGPGCLALARRPGGEPGALLAHHPEGMWLVAAGVSDPGNLGALARSAEAFGAVGLMTLAGGASPWSPKALRGSMGSLLRLPVLAEVEPDRLQEVLLEAEVRSLCAVTRDGAAPEAVDWSGNLALWVSSETGEFPRRSMPFEEVSLPMEGGVESLNVTVAASVLLYAARTGRKSRG